MKENGFLNQTLISQDAGWYWVGEPGGGAFRGYTAIFEKFIPALKKEGFTDDEVKQLLVHNPRETLTIKVRKI
jgi:phosphotriesterase-related protein